MSGPRYVNFDTLSLHAGQKPDPATGARATPIYQTTSFVFRDSDHAAALFNAERPGHVYSRITNPTTAVLEERVAALEGGVGAIATASGQAAMHLAIATIVGAGEHIVASSALYGGSHNLLSYTLPRFGIETTFVDPRDPTAFRAAIRPETRLVFSETLGNPGLDVLDVPAVAEVAHAAGLPLLVDSTFTTPYLMRPFDHGADLVFHSATKFLGGHGVAIGGVLVDGGTFDWDASGRFPTPERPLCRLPRPGVHRGVRPRRVHHARAQGGGARLRGLHEPDHRVPHPARGGDPVATHGAARGQHPQGGGVPGRPRRGGQRGVPGAARAPGPRACEAAAAARLRGGVQLRTRRRARGGPGVHRIAAGVLPPRERRGREVPRHPSREHHPPPDGRRGVGAGRGSRKARSGSRSAWRTPATCSTIWGARCTCRNGPQNGVSTPHGTPARNGTPALRSRKPAHGGWRREVPGGRPAGPCVHRLPPLRPRLAARRGRAEKTSSGRAAS